MDSPVFKLEKVVHARSEELQDFEGPLDLILFLLSRNKVEIQDIPIALICDQYLAWLAARKGMDLEVASEFVSMASHLVYLKTRMLLALEDEETKSEMDALIQSLEERRRNEEYAVIKLMAGQLAPLSEFGRNIVTRPPEPVKHGKVFEYSHDPADLLAAAAELRSRTERKLPSPSAAFRQIVRHEPFPVETKSKEILRRLAERGVFRLMQLFRGCRSRSEIVATFLAVLELIRGRLLRLRGDLEDAEAEPGEAPPDELIADGEAGNAGALGSAELSGSAAESMA